MLSCGLSQNTHTHCGDGFDPSSPVPTKQLTQYLLLNDVVSPAGSIYNLLVSQDLGIEQSFSDFIHETISDPISFVQLGQGSVDRFRSLSDDLGITDSFVFAGTAGGGEGGTGPTPISAIFDSTTDEGMVLYVPSNGHVDLAKADIVATSGAVGLAEENVVATGTGTYITEGQVEKTDWTSVVGTTLLTPGAVYFLSIDDEGEMTTIAPDDSPGESSVRIGTALTTQIFDIEISQPVLL